MSYTYTAVTLTGPGITNDIIKRSDGAFIPADSGNVDWQAYQAWLSAGNTPNPAPVTLPAGQGPTN